MLVWRAQLTAAAEQAQPADDLLAFCFAGGAFPAADMFTCPTERQVVQSSHFPVLEPLVLILFVFFVHSVALWCVSCVARRHSPLQTALVADGLNWEADSPPTGFDLCHILPNK